MNFFRSLKPNIYEIEVDKIKKKLDIRILIILLVISSFALATYPLSTFELSKMGDASFFFETVTPFPYWIGLATILGILVYCFTYLEKQYYVPLFLSFSIVLMTLIRCVFPFIFESVIIYEPDSTSYISIVSGWVRTSVDIGVSGNYQHDYPLSFLIAFLFGKLGVSIELYYRFAPFFIYAINIILIYSIMLYLTTKPKIAALSSFLLAISPLNYWLSVHYCPDLLGSLFFLLSLFLIIRLVKNETTRLSYVIPVLISIFMLILSHHLSTLYFIVTTLGIAFCMWFFKSQFKNKALFFLLIGIYAYTLWFVYGTLMYPEFFNVYSYFSQSGSAVTLARQANLFENLTFAIYPAFILISIVLYFKKTFGIKKILSLLKKPLNLFKSETYGFKLPVFLVYALGYIFVFALFFVGLVIPNIFAPRVLEVLLMGLYPLSATYLSELNLSRKKSIILFIIILIVIILGTHRYYSQIQGRVLG